VCVSKPATAVASNQVATWWRPVQHFWLGLLPMTPLGQNRGVVPHTRLGLPCELFLFFG